MKTYKIQILLLLLALLAIYLIFGDEVAARVLGLPVKLVAATESIESNSIKENENLEFVHVFSSNGALKIVVRTYFWSNIPLAQPYLTTNEQNEGVLHLGLKYYVSFSTGKCVHLRQVEVEVPEEYWQKLASIKIENSDGFTYLSSENTIQIKNIETLLSKSMAEIALQSLENTRAGCSA